MATNGLYGGSTVQPGLYFEWFIFIESATLPATPTGGSWNFITETGTPPSGWSTVAPPNPVNPVYMSTTIVNSSSSEAYVWSAPGQIFRPGTPGTAATIAVGTTTTGAAGTSASVNNSGNDYAAVFNFTIPRGDTGDTGPTGATGSPGAAATIAAGTTTTGAAGTSASVTNSGTSSAAVFDFTIPRGDTGATGPTGATGATGAGVPTGGTTGQILAKNSGTDYDTSWVTLAGGLQYKGSWDASTNTPTLASGVGTNGFYYVVSVAGSTNLDGITDWLVGDWAIYNGVAWQKIDQTNTVTSVNSQTGAVVLTAADVGALTNVTSTDGSVTVSTPSTGVRDLSVAVAAATNNVICQVRNSTGATLTKGTAVYISGATGQIPTVSKALATSDATSAQTLGLLTADLANNSNGNVTIIGLITNIDTSAYTDGAQLYLSGTTAGTLTATKPYAPIHLVYVAVVEHAHPTQGKLFVKVQNGYELDELHNVSAQSPSNGQTIIYNATTSLWEKGTLTPGTGISVTNGAGSITIANTGVTSVTGTAPVSSSGGATPVISMAAATTSVNGYLTSTDWTTFNNKQAALVSGTNIKTVASNSLLGSGDVGFNSLTPTQTGNAGKVLTTDGTSATWSGISGGTF